MKEIPAQIAGKSLLFETAPALNVKLVEPLHLDSDLVIKKSCGNESG